MTETTTPTTTSAPLLLVVDEPCTLQSHAALRRSASAWEALTVVSPARDYGGLVLELRNCRCGSTLARELPAEAA